MVNFLKGCWGPLLDKHFCCGLCYLQLFFVFGRAVHICSAFLYLVVLRVFAAHVLSILICWCFFRFAYVFLSCSMLSSLGLRKNEPHWPVNDVTIKIPNSYFFIFNSALQYIHWIFFVSLMHCALTDIFLSITTAVFSMHSKNLSSLNCSCSTLQLTIATSPYPSIHLESNRGWLCNKIIHFCLPRNGSIFF